MTQTRMPEFMYGMPGKYPLTAVWDEAVEDLLNRMWPEHFPDNVEIATFKRAKIKPDGFNPLGHMLEQLDEEYADPDQAGDTSPTKAMLQAERTFITTVLAEYRPHQMEQDTTETVDVRKWLERNPGKLPNAR